MDTATAATIESLREQLAASRQACNDIDRDLARAMLRAEVLAAEVKAWHDGNDQHDFLGWCRDNGDTENHYTIMGAKDRTDRTHALDAAKFEVKP